MFKKFTFAKEKYRPWTLTKKSWSIIPRPREKKSQKKCDIVPVKRTDPCGVLNSPLPRKLSIFALSDKIIMTMHDVGNVKNSLVLRKPFYLKKNK